MVDAVWALVDFYMNKIKKSSGFFAKAIDIFKIKLYNNCIAFLDNSENAKALFFGGS